MSDVVLLLRVGRRRRWDPSCDSRKVEDVVEAAHGLELDEGADFTEAPLSKRVAMGE